MHMSPKLSLYLRFPHQNPVLEHLFPIGSAGLIPQMSRKKFYFMDLGLEIRVD